MKRMKFGSIFTMFLGLVALMSGLAGCEDKITDGEITVDNEKLVTVPLAFDFAPETDGYEIASGSGGGGGGKRGGGGGGPPPITPCCRKQKAEGL